MFESYDASLFYLRSAQHVWHSFKHKKAVDSRNLSSKTKSNRPTKKQVKQAEEKFSYLTALLVRHPLWHIGWHLVGNL